MVEFSGMYTHEKDENFDEFLKAIGTGFVVRKIGTNSYPSVEVKVTGDSWCIVTRSLAKTWTWNFDIGKELMLDFSPLTDKRVVITLDGNTLLTTDLDELETTTERVFTDDGMTQVLNHKPSKTVGKRYFKKEK